MCPHSGTYVFRLSPTREASRYPYPKCMLHRQKSPSNRARKQETYFASKERGNSNKRRLSPRTQISGVVEEMAHSLGCRPQRPEGERAPPARSSVGREGDSALSAQIHRKRGAAMPNRIHPQMTGRGEEARRSAGRRKRATHAGICSVGREAGGTSIGGSPLVLGLLLENDRFGCVILFLCDPKEQMCLVYR